MQPNGNRPVYIVQPSNVTHLNVRPTNIATGGQPPVYQISTVRQPTIPQQATPIYQVSPQTRLISPTPPPVYNSLPTQRFATSPQTILTTNTNISPRPITSVTVPRLPVVTSQPAANAITLRPTVSAVSTPPTATSASASTTSQSAASGSKDLVVRVPK